jgi:hypothetical protein
MENIKEFTIGDKVRWFYQIDKWSKPTDEIVYIADKPKGNRVRIDRKDKNGNIIEKTDKNGNIIEGGYVLLDELYSI